MTSIGLAISTRSRRSTSSAGDIKYSPKDGAFIVDEEKVPEDATFAALCGETLVGFRKFNGPGQLPDEKMGLLYSGFVMPQVSERCPTATRAVGARP